MHQKNKQEEEQSMLQRFYKTLAKYHKAVEKVQDKVSEDSSFACCIHTDYYPATVITLWEKDNYNKNHARVEFIYDEFEIVRKAVYSEEEIKNAFKDILSDKDNSLMIELSQCIRDLLHCEKAIVKELEFEDTFSAVVHYHTYPIVYLTLWKDFYATSGDVDNDSNAEVWFDKNGILDKIISGRYVKEEILKYVSRII